jgi:recombinational DNA repair protein (RecF pathway)
MGAALAVLELLDGVCYWESPEPRIVDLVLDYLACPAPEDPVFLFLAFELKLLAVLGAIPDFSACAACGGSLAEGFFDPEQGECACPRHSAPSPQRIALDADLTALLVSLDGEALFAAAGRKIGPDSRKRLGSVLHWTYTFHVQNYRLPESLRLIPKE